jgi:hypothetical protein
VVFLALALSLWIASDTKQHLDLRVTPAASQYVTFQHLHSDLYLVQAAVLHADGHVSLITREVVVTN